MRVRVCLCSVYVYQRAFQIIGTFPQFFSTTEIYVSLLLLFENRKNEYFVERKNTA